MIDWAKTFYYDHSSPSGLRWTEDRHSNWSGGTVVATKGSVVGTKNVEGYWKVHYQDDDVLRQVFVHNIIWELTYGLISDGMVVDHIDGNPSNPRLDNLRLVTLAVNRRNSKKAVNNTSGKTGVSRVSAHNGRSISWMSCVKDLTGKRHFKSFSINKYGEEKAFELACLTRDTAIAALNLQGAGYSERHGKET